MAHNRLDDEHPDLFKRDFCALGVGECCGRAGDGLNDRCESRWKAPL